MTAKRLAAIAEAGRLEAASDRHCAEGDYEQATLLAERAVLVREEALGPDFPGLSNALRCLARAREASGAIDEAERHLLRALALDEARLGSPEHPSLVSSLDVIASFYGRHKAYEKVDPVILRIVGIAEKGLGTSHPSLVKLLYALALSKRRQRMFDEAEALMLRALDISEKGIGPDDEQTLQIMLDLGLQNLHLSMVRGLAGAHEKAMSLMERAAAIAERKSDNKSMFEVAQRAFDVLAEAYQKHGDFANAESALLRQLALFENAPRPDNLGVAYALDQLSTYYQSRGEHAKAEPLAVRVLNLRQAALGESHPDVVAARESLAAIYEAKGDIAAARLLAPASPTKSELN